MLLQEMHAMSGRTVRCHCKFLYMSNFTTASCGFPATARLSCWSLSETVDNDGLVSKVSEEVATEIGKDVVDNPTVV